MRALLLLFLVALAGCGAFAKPGTACSKHDDCAGLDEGYCSRAEICVRECPSSGSCPDQSACVATPARSVCLPTCERDDDCLDNFRCTGGTCQLAQPLDPPP